MEELLHPLPIYPHSKKKETATFVFSFFTIISSFLLLLYHIYLVLVSSTLPVIGIPIPSEPFKGVDALLAMVQMPPGIPVGVVTAGKAGGKNSALYAASILALSDKRIADKLKEFRVAQTAMVEAADAELQAELQ